MSITDAQVLPRGGALWMATAVLLVAAHPLLAQQPASQPWEAGKEIRVDDPAAGTDGYFLVHVPADYDPNERWPMVFYYHGLGGRPDADRISRVMLDKYCIVVGMSYYAPGMEGYRFLETEDVRILRHVLAAIKKHLSVNDKRLYVAGFSKGGFYTCEMLRQLSDLLAGVIVMGAGSKSLDAPWPSLAGKEVFIGCGEKDPFNGAAKATRDRLAALGATVTFDEWPQVGHAVGDAAKLRIWLFEQTVNRLAVASGDWKDHDDADTPPARGAAISRSVPWLVGAMLLSGIVATITVILRRQRKAALSRTASPSHAKDWRP